MTELFPHIQRFAIERLRTGGKLSADLEGTVGCFVLGLANAVTARQEDVIIVLLICLVVAMIASALLISRVAHWQLLKRQRASRLPAPSTLPISIFDAPRRWLAVRSERPEAVEAALGVANARVCSWSDALAGSSEPRLFISPPLRGWVLVMGCDLPDPSEDIDGAFLFLKRLSEKLGEVQFYSRVRPLSHHGWARLERGKVVRAYCWAGETLWNQGAVTEAEREFKMRCFPYSYPAETVPFGEREALSLNTDKVLRLAASWSVDPTSLEPSALESKGIAGALSSSKFH